MADLNKLTVKEAQDLLRNKDISAVELVCSCVKQIEAYDSSIKAFITVLKEEAIELAKEVDKKIQNEGDKAFEGKPLLGIPYAIKDNFSTKGVLTTSASKMLDNYIPPFDATVVRRINEAGAIMLGKTNMDAFAHGSSTESSDFFTTKNPWNKDKIPGGSSGGSGAAVIADMCIFAVGSETGGSIRCPASWCGITGFKPSYGRVSRYGVTAMASSTDSPGPMTKTVEDSAIVLEVIAGKDPLDATTTPESVPSYYSKNSIEREEMEQIDISKIKIGKPKSYFEIDIEPDVKKLVEDGVKKLEKLGAEIVEVDLMDPKYSIAVYTVLQRSEVSSNLGRLDGIRYGNTRDNFGTEAKKRIMLGTYALSAGYYDEFYGKAQKVRTLLVEDFAKTFEKVDLIVGPSMPCVAMDIGAIDSSPLFGELIDLLNEPSSIAGLPAVSLPVGLSQELPVGMQLIGPQLSESMLINVASKFQEVSNYHKERPIL